ncbi:AmmeMemoRadiSam system protein B [Candidatus Peregrinibacteria bacterium]|nr:AmmeMemoRadiSam system protein B [Candidatus Peregrinibacteria bacterium]
MELISKIFLFKALVIVLTGAFLTACGNEKDVSFEGMLVPHHLLVEQKIGQLYAGLDNDFDQIYLIGPNHFGHGFNFIQTDNQDFAANSNAEPNKEAIAKDHGITNHFPFIKKYLRNSELISITLKNDTPKERLDNLIDQIRNMARGEVLIIASIDFTHLEFESAALENDNRIIEWLSYHDSVDYKEIMSMAKTINPSNKESIAIDSPETIYVIANLMKNKDFVFVERTSTTSLTSIDEPSMFTSHIFGYFK